MRRIRLSLSLFIAVFALMVTMPACKTLDNVLNKEDSSKSKPTKIKKKKTTAPKATKAKEPKSETTKAKKEIKKEPDKKPAKEVTKQEAKEEPKESAPVYEPPLRGSPKSRVGGGTR